MKLIITRHGETIENIKHISQGHMPGTLSENGIQQAKLLAKRLKDYPIDAIYSFDLARAADTAKEIAEFHPNIPLILVEDLREGDLGKYAGQNLKGIDWSKRPREMESRESMCKRSKAIIDRAYEEYPDGTVIFVTHNGTALALMAVIYGKDPDYMETISKQMGPKKNTSLSIFEIKEDRSHEVICLNCAKHLD